MKPRPSFDVEILIVIVLNVVLIVGLGWTFLTNDPSEPPLSPTVEPTTISSDDTPVETEALPPSSSATQTPEETTPTATEPSPESYPGPPAETLPAEGTPPDISATPKPGQAEPLPIGKHDDTDPNILYDRFWTFRMNSGTKFAYLGTLHTSDSIGNELSFLFTGGQIILGYQRGRSFGTVTVLIDDQSYSFHEQAFDNLWRSPQLSPGTHSVRLIHENGESVNLDYIEVRP